MTLLEDYDAMTGNNADGLRNKVYAAMAKAATAVLQNLTGELDTEQKKREVRQARAVLRGTASHTGPVVVALVAGGMAPDAIDTAIQSAVDTHYPKLAYLFDSTLDEMTGV